MSANVRFDATGKRGANTGSSSSTSAAKPREVSLILPYDTLAVLLGSRVTLLLSVRDEELEGLLRTVDADRGDVVLEDVVHYRWRSEPSGAVGERESAGGGYRTELRRSEVVMVNSRYIEIITPTVFTTTD